ncbi:calcium-binding protein [Methyloradius palustris]|uniref:Haemolysin-type calcium binding-related domain-containing protein n=1 Tax=Methyloradius palustris TaxID=2778876 RepID=A0A8D5G9H8_9PROT|nr:calcium-binding protein [Methyloradius palustris]BCM25597.1 hypothetical protein ZMTM_18560 [Methyloradius palustris]
MSYLKLAEEVVEAADQAKSLDDFLKTVTDSAGQEQAIDALKAFMGAAATGLAGLAGAPLIPAIGIGLILGYGAEYVIDHLPTPRTMTDEEFWAEWQMNRNLRLGNYGINAGVSTAFKKFSNFPQRSDPFTLDLNGNGVETTGISNTNPILFDVDADGIKTSTGWVAPSDGLLVMDRNGNGYIDNGRELFGDATLKSNGQLAADGFDAIADQDTNQDGIVSSLDDNWDNLLVWRDLNQDGISQANELTSLNTLGIASINVTSVEHNTLLNNGNVLADLGTFTYSDGTSGTAGTAANLADVNLVQDTFNSEFTDHIPLTTQAATLPDLQGSGQVRDLREAASLSPSLAALLTQFASATRAEQHILIDAILKAWSDTSTMATTFTGAYAGHNLTVDMQTWYTGIITGSADYQAMVDKLTIMEHFNGRTYQPIPTGTDDVTLTLWHNAQYLLNQSYDELKNSVFNSLHISGVYDTLVKPMLDKIGLVISDTGFSLDFSELNADFNARIALNPSDGILDLIDFYSATKSDLRGSGWQGQQMILDFLTTHTLTSEIGIAASNAGLFLRGYTAWNDGNGSTGDDYIRGNDQPNTISGASGNDTIIGGNGYDSLDGGDGNDIISGGGYNDNLNGGDGDDTLIGGVGNDYLVGGNGNDTYRFSLGDGQDYIDNTVNSIVHQDTIQFTNVDSASLTSLTRSGNNLIINYGTSDSITLWNRFYVSNVGASFDQFIFSDGAYFTLPQLYGAYAINLTSDSDNVSFDTFAVEPHFTYTANMHILAGAGNDTVSSGVGNDTLEGGDGNDSLTSGNGNDLLVGGAGADTLNGGIGIDTASYLTSTAGVQVNLLTGASHGGDAEGDYLVGIENLIGSSNSDVLTGNAGNNLLDGQAGADTLTGGAGDDTYIVDDLGDVVIENVNEGIDTIKASISYTLGDYVENLTLTGSTANNATGNALSNIIQGNAANNIILGNGGNDTLIGGAGDDTYIVDDLGDVVIENAYEGIDIIKTSVSYTLGDYVENLTLTGSTAINATGNALSNIIQGNAANNIILGNGGNDTLIGGAGDDFLDGGTGSDTYVFSKGDGVDVISSSDSSDKISFLDVGVNELTSLDQIGNDLVIKYGDSDVLTIQSYFSSPDNSIMSFWFSDQALRFSQPPTLSDLRATFLLTDGGTNTGPILGTSNDDYLGGAYYAAEIRGLGGNDTLSGGSYNGVKFNDTLVGGIGNDELWGGGGDDTYVFNLGDGQDSINNSGDVASTTRGILKFGSGILSSQISLSVSNYDLTFAIDGTSDQVTIMGWTAGSLFQIREIQFDDGTNWNAEYINSMIHAGNDTLTSSSYSPSDYINGYAGDDALYGQGGNDTLEGGIGNDYLSGKGGSDTYLFGLGDGQDTINNYDDSATASTSVDTLKFAAGISTSDISFSINGTDLVLSIANTTDQITIQNWTVSQSYHIQQIEFANGSIWDAAAIEDFVANIGDSGGGDGGTGGGSGSTTVVNGTEGDDYISAFTTDAQLISGLAGNDTIFGSLGQDTLEGNAGNDYLSGGGASDTYLFNLGDGQDTISNYDDLATTSIDTLKFGTGIAASDVTVGVSGDDLILSIGASTDQVILQSWNIDQKYRHQQVVFADGTTWDSTYLSNEYLIAKLSGDDYLSPYSTDDQILKGFAGNDTIFGSLGNDTLEGGIGNDYLNGQTGSDTYIFNLGDGQDIINNYDDSATDSLKFGTGISESDITIGLSGSDLILSIANTTDQITIQNWGYGQDYRLDQVEFADGTSWDSAYLNDQYLRVKLSGDDYLSLDTTDDQLLKGFTGNDTIYGSLGNDTLEGGIGNDYLGGQGGSDTYLFGLGDGQDTINNYDDSSTATTSVDTLKFGAGISTSDISFTINGSDLILSIANTTDQITIQNWTVSQSYKLQQIEFANGSIWDAVAIEGLVAGGGDGGGGDPGDGGNGGDGGGAGNGNVINGTEDSDYFTAIDDNPAYLKGLGGDDTIIGYTGNDTLEGGAGNDFLMGQTGNDTYKFNLGDGQDIIGDYDATPGNIDTLHFGAGINASDISFTLQGVDLVLGISGTDDQVKIADWGYGQDHYIENVQFADGTVWDNGYLNTQYLQALLSGDDYLTAPDDQDALVRGFAGNDTLWGFAGNDTLEGGTGNDYLAGQVGNDLYRFNIGDGQDTIGEYDSTPGNTDTLSFGENISSSDIIFSTQGSDLILGISGTSDQVTLLNWSYGSDYRIETVQFNNGTVWDADYLNTEYLKSSLSGDDYLTPPDNQDALLRGFAGNDTIWSFDGNDTLAGGTGNDFLAGQLGNDTYIFNAGDGQDTVYDWDQNSDPSNVDTLKFGAGIGYDQLWFTQSDNNLEISVIGTTDKTIIQDWYSGSSYHVEEIATADGNHTLIDTQVQNLVNAMAGLTPPAAGQTSLPPAYQAQLAPVLAANWS